MSKVEIIKHPIEQAGKNIKLSAWSAVLESLIVMVFGILCVIWPDTIIQAIAYLVGAFFIIRGGIALIDYFVESSQKASYSNKLLSGVICIILGIIAFVAGQDIAHVFSIVIGIFIIYESLVRLNAAIRLRSANANGWKELVAISIAMMIIGIVVTFATGGAVMLAGWLMIAAGVIGIVGDVVFIQHVNMVVDKLTGKKK
ncbi:DUF308 domain-containing protein [Candidatus Saccharibacteria bacterium]|nr:DUF308 domain-containing protein [Candidatus Saccharibacteria bacterium]